MDTEIKSSEKVRKLEVDTVFTVNGRLAIRLTTFAKLLHYSEIYLLTLIKKLLKHGIKIGFKWKRNWYIFLPKFPIKLIPQNNNQNTEDSENNAITPSGNEINTDWDAAINELPYIIGETLKKTVFKIVTFNKKLIILLQTTNLNSSTLNPKNLIEFSPSNLGLFPAMTDYKYGSYIIYNQNKMSIFDPGTAGTLKSTQVPQAFFEICRALDAAENTRNGANPGLPARRNLSTTVSFDTGTIAIAATLPITTNIQSNGSIDITASDYLGSGYSTFTNGGGDLKSDTLPEALLEMASTLAAAEKAVTPTENQPNNVQIQFDIEAGSATISANLPFNTLAATNGDVTIHAIDYL